MSEKARFKLAMALNNIVAAPSFQSWINGEPLDIQKLMYQPNGRARVSIFYIAHLNEAERQFIITLILENMLGWMRMQSGTTSLRSILYIDEMFGYFPPYPTSRRIPRIRRPKTRCCGCSSRRVLLAWDSCWRPRTPATWTTKGFPMPGRGSSGA